MKVSVLLALVAALALAPAAVAHDHRGGELRKIDHFVVIYQENHSFDNLYGGWEKVDGLRKADAAHTRQINQAGPSYQCLKQVDVNLTAPPLTATCTDTTTGTAFTSHFPNAPFQIDDYIAPDRQDVPRARVCSPPTACSRTHRRAARRLHARPRAPLLPGAVPAQRRPPEPLRDRFGRRRPHDGHLRHPQAAGLQVPAREARSPNYVISDRFFQAAFGGSFLNHQWLVAAATPVFFNARDERGGRPALAGRCERDADAAYPLYTAARPGQGPALTVPCGSPQLRRAGVRRLRGQHDPAAVPAVCAGHRARAPAAAADGTDDR